MTALLLYAHLATVLGLMMVDATFSVMFKKKYRILKSLVKRTLWPLYAVFYLIGVYLTTKGYKRQES